MEDYFTESFVYQAPIIIILTSVFLRTMNKYGDRGYNFALLEAGHIGQNIYLLCANLQLSICSVGGFYEDTLSSLLGIENDGEFPIYTLAVG